MTRLSLSEVSTVAATFEEDVAAYAAAGFDAIGIWEVKLPADDTANLELLAERGLAVANCVPAIPSFLPLQIPGMEGPADPAERLAALEASVRRLARYAPESVVCLTGPVGERDPSHAHAIVVDGLRRVAAVARAADVPLGLEPIHRTQARAVSFLNSIGSALALLHEARADDVGLLLDFYHVWDDPAIWDTIDNAGDRIAGVHVSDWPADATRTDRELPGHGVSRTGELVDALVRSGFGGSLDVEIFGTPDGFWGLPVEEAARQAHDAVAALLD